MPKGLSLHLGVNYVNEAHYGNRYQLNWSHNDALSMKQIAVESGYETYCLLNEDATTGNFFSITEKAKELLPGDIFLLTFSGHGTQCPDYNLDEQRNDFFDEAWVLYDRMLLDDEGVNCWLDFNPEVRIVIVTDCCYSGLFWDRAKARHHKDIGDECGIRSLSPYYAEQIIKEKWLIYEEFVMSKKKFNCSQVMSPSIQLCACNEYEGAGEYACYEHGAFTHTLLNVWESGESTNYKDFHKNIIERMPVSCQTPELKSWGSNCNNFLKQRPFTI